jgi:hypothetical protein
VPWTLRAPVVRGEIGIVQPGLSKLQALAELHDGTESGVLSLLTVLEDTTVADGHGVVVRVRLAGALDGSSGPSAAAQRRRLIHMPGPVVMGKPIHIETAVALHERRLRGPRTEIRPWSQQGAMGLASEPTGTARRSSPWPVS